MGWAIKEGNDTARIKSVDENNKAIIEFDKLEIDKEYTIIFTDANGGTGKIEHYMVPGCKNPPTECASEWEISITVPGSDTNLFFPISGIKIAQNPFFFIKHLKDGEWENITGLTKEDILITENGLNKGMTDYEILDGQNYSKPPGSYIIKWHTDACNYRGKETSFKIAIPNLCPYTEHTISGTYGEKVSWDIYVMSKTHFPPSSEEFRIGFKTSVEPMDDGPNCNIETGIKQGDYAIPVLGEEKEIGEYDPYGKCVASGSVKFYIDTIINQSNPISIASFDAPLDIHNKQCDNHTCENCIKIIGSPTTGAFKLYVYYDPNGTCS